jgi:L-asparaginase
MNKKNITIIATGGTIAGRGSLGKSANYEAGTFDVEEIVKSIPQIRDLANLNTIQLYNVDSNDMGLDKWIELRKICHELEKDRYVDGIVITHGKTAQTRLHIPAKYRYQCQPILRNSLLFKSYVGMS